MQHLLWDAHQDDGSCAERWSLEGEEQVAPPWTTRQVHVYTLIPRNAQVRCGMRGNIFVAGWEMPDAVGAWHFLSPTG